MSTFRVFLLRRYLRLLVEVRGSKEKFHFVALHAQFCFERSVKASVVLLVILAFAQTVQRSTDRPMTPCGSHLHAAFGSKTPTRVVRRAATVLT